MKTIIRNRAIRSVCLLVVGFLLVWCSDEAPKWLVQGVGALLVVPGVVSLLSLFRKDTTKRELILYPIVGVVTIVFGFILILWPSSFVRASMYVLAVLLVILGSSQIYSRWRMQKLGIDINGATFLLPLVTIGAGIFILVNTELAAALPFIVLGAAYMLHSLFELWSVFCLAKFVKAHPEIDAPALPETVAQEETTDGYSQAEEVVEAEASAEEPSDEKTFDEIVEEIEDNPANASDAEN